MRSRYIIKELLDNTLLTAARENAVLPISQYLPNQISLLPCSTSFPSVDGTPLNRRTHMDSLGFLQLLVSSQDPQTELTTYRNFLIFLQQNPDICYQLYPSTETDSGTSPAVSLQNSEIQQRLPFQPSQQPYPQFFQGAPPSTSQTIPKENERTFFGRLQLNQMRLRSGSYQHYQYLYPKNEKEQQTKSTSSPNFSF